MYLLIDGQALQTPDSRHRGIGRYTSNLIRAVARARPSWRVEVVWNHNLEPISQDQVGDVALLEFVPPLPPAEETRAANARYYADWLAARGPDAILLTSCFEYNAVVPWFGRCRPPVYTVMYDLIPLVFSDYYLGDRGTRARYGHHFRLALNAEGLLAISEATARDVRSLAGPDCPAVVNVAGAPDPAFAPLPEPQLAATLQEVRQRIRLDREFILFVGGNDFRKNMPNAIRAFAALGPEYHARFDLVIVCQLTADARLALEAEGRAAGVGHALKLTGFINDEELRALYQSCRLFFFPSLYEGLGLPVVEALSCGAPVVASNCSSVPEYAGPCSWLADPTCPQAMAQAIRQALDEPRDARLSERVAFAQTFTWERTAEQACQLIEQPRPPAVPRRRRIAWVSPLPPVPSGISDYSQEMLAHLRDRFDIELVVDPRQRTVAAPLAIKHAIITGQEMASRHQARPYDLIVYHVGNSVFHVYMLELLACFPGLVVLHDYHLGGLFWEAQRAAAWPADMAQELADDGEWQLAAWVRQKHLPEWVARELSALNRLVLQQATSVVVHSAYTWRLVRRRVDVPVAHIPLSCMAPPLGSREEERARLGMHEDDFVVCTLGLVGPPKRVPSLLRSLTHLPSALRSRTRLFIVGEISEHDLAEVERQARERGVEDQVRCIGRVPLDLLSAYARAADVCVQLRYPSRGETSAALARALTVGAACITSDQGAMDDLPADVVYKVRSPHREVEDLTVALQRLADSPEQRRKLGENARRYAEDRLSITQVASQYASFLDLSVVAAEQADQQWAALAQHALSGCLAPEQAECLLSEWRSLRQQAQMGRRRVSCEWPRARLAA
jgi:glycosyltransferase involved in cell wall biosynthesis